LAAALAFVILRLERVTLFERVLQRLQDTTAQIRIRGAFMLLVRGLPALLYRPLIGTRRSLIAGLLQATSLSFIVAASQIGLDLHLITKASGAALVAAGLLSVLIFPILALTLLRSAEKGNAL
ncbi:MAG: hypothetical protein H0U76_03245, partial [Ktedonobacteraceae bacterium]|nr:hypothetical protein [Ktedonobacteraceae bacterium]